MKNQEKHKNIVEKLKECTFSLVGESTKRFALAAIIATSAGMTNIASADIDNHNTDNYTFNQLVDKYNNMDVNNDMPICEDAESDNCRVVENKEELKAVIDMQESIAENNNYDNMSIDQLKETYNTNPINEGLPICGDAQPDNCRQIDTRAELLKTIQMQNSIERGSSVTFEFDNS